MSILAWSRSPPRRATTAWCCAKITATITLPRRRRAAAAVPDILPTTQARVAGPDRSEHESDRERRPADRNGRPDLSDPVLHPGNPDPDRAARREARLSLGLGQRPHDHAALRTR